MVPRHDGFTSVSGHSMIDTNHALVDKLLISASTPVLIPVGAFAMKTSEEGSGTSIFCATSPDALKDAGKFFDRCIPYTPDAQGSNDQLADALFERTEQEIATWKAKPQAVAAAAPAAAAPVDEEKKAGTE